MKSFQPKSENNMSETNDPTKQQLTQTQLYYVPCYFYQNWNMLSSPLLYQQLPQQLNPLAFPNQFLNAPSLQQNQIKSNYQIKQEEIESTSNQKIQIEEGEEQKNEGPGKKDTIESESIPSSIPFSLKKKHKSLAQRNIKHNFASGVRDFIKFKINKLKLMSIQDEEVLKKQKELLAIHKWIQSNKKHFRCFDGWLNFKIDSNQIKQRKEMLQDPENGYKFIKISQIFFSKSFAQIYIKQSRIMEKYKQEHLEKISKFKVAVKNIKLFNPFFFKE